MATLKATGGSILSTITSVSDAVNAGVSGSSIWFSQWANGVQQRAETERERTLRLEQGKRALVNEIVAKDLAIVIKEISTIRSKDTDSYDQALKVLNSITE